MMLLIAEIRNAQIELNVKMAIALRKYKVHVLRLDRKFVF